MSYTAASIPDLSGRVAVVTGGNGGLGLETARGLAGAGAHVVVAARNQAKAQRAMADILESHPTASAELVELDLGSLDSVKAAAQKISKAHAAIDILVNNAGLMALPERQTADGFEMQFGVNHLGHWALTAQLMPALLGAQSARVVALTSMAHHFGQAVDLDDPHLSESYGPWRAYNQSKLANYHFALGLDQEFRKAGVPAISLMAHPGLTNSDLQEHSSTEGGGFFATASVTWAKLTGMSTEAGARPTLRAATDPEAEGGTLYGPLFVTNGPPVKRRALRPGNDAAIAALWRVSERETGLPMTVR